MKKIALISVAAFLGLKALAEGYQVNVLSARQSAMGHVGTAMQLGAESMHFNPAGMAFMKETADFSVGVGAISPTAYFKKDGVTSKTDNDISTPLYAYAAFRIYDNLKGGIAFTTPYGSSINWGKNWPGATLAQKVTLKAFCLQPTLSWKINDKFSIGAGLMLDWGSVDLNKGLITGSYLAGTFSQINAQMGTNYSWDPAVTPVSVNLTGKAKVKAGFNVGAMWNINEQFTVGVCYRSKITAKVEKGEASLEYAKEDLRTIFKTLSSVTGKDVLPSLDEAEFSAEMPMPSNLTVGVTYKPNSRLTTSLDIQMTGWSAYEELNVIFPYVTYNDTKPYVNTTVKNYKDSFAVRAGAQYALTERFDVRAGFYFDQSPVRGDYYNPETPGMGKLGPSCGFSFRPFTGFSIDFALLYIEGISRHGSMSDNNGNVILEGDYDLYAWSPSFGLSYKF